MESNNGKFWDKVNEMKNNRQRRNIIPKIAKEGYSLIEILDINDIAEDLYVGRSTSDYVQFPNALWHISSNIVYDEPIKHEWNLVKTENGLGQLVKLLKELKEEANPRTFVLHYKKTARTKKFKLKIFNEQEAMSYKNNFDQNIK